MAKQPLTDSNCHIGTSGWQYDSWTDNFYPEGISKADMLSHYARHFKTVEVNNSFYQLPSREAVRTWNRQTPADFRFCAKASRYLTHMKKLKDADDGLQKFLSALAPMEDKLAVILFQLPPNWRANRERLEAFLPLLPRDFRYAFEFRDRSWLCEDIYELLREYNAANCFYDYQGYTSPEVATADFIYLRLHGPQEAAYQGSYDGRTLAGYARKMLRWQREGKEIYCYFDNDDKACAPADTEQLLGSLQRQAK